MAASVEVPALELRISIQDAEPEIWRQLVLPQTATLAEAHEAIQVAFGWKNTHLYVFYGTGPDGKRRVITVLDDESPVGAESSAEVGLLELFDPSLPGRSPFEYEYDFGDSWTHEIDVVGPAELHGMTARCTDGAMRGPIEDSGGVFGYANVVRVVGDQRHPEHREAVDWLELVTQERASAFDPTTFDLHAVNEDLRRLSRRLWPSEVTEADRVTALAPILWFLSEAEPDGLPLTSAGYLKPAFVKHAMTALNWDDGWVSTGRVEVSTAPIRNLREQLQEWKLLRKYKDKLLLTPAARQLVGDPAGLWDYVVARLATPDNDAAAVLLPLIVHWELTGNEPPYRLMDQVIEAALHHAGLRVTGDAPPYWAGQLYHDVSRGLHRIELWERPSWDRVSEPLSDVGIKFLLDLQSRLDANVH